MSGVKITGLRENIAAMKKAGVEVADLKEAFAPISDKAAAQARALAPRRSGRLAGNVRASRRQNAAVITVGGARVYYARYVHFGSVHNPRPVPFMFQAVDALARSGWIEDAVERGLTVALRRAGL